MLIEQGNNLETAHTNICIVEGIVGMKPYTIIVNGKANHAGTTPLKQRKDVLLTAAKLIIAINAWRLNRNSRQSFYQSGFARSVRYQNGFVV